MTLSKLHSAKKQFRSTLTALKVKLTLIDAELEKVSQGFEDLMDEVSKYQGEVEAQVQKKLSKIREIEEAIDAPPPTPKEDLDIAASIGIWEVILRAMTKDAEDFRLACDSIIFPTVYEKIVEGQKFYLLDEVPNSAIAVIEQGKELLKWLRTEYETHLTYPTAWPLANEIISEWWLGTALPLIYGSRDDAWDEAIAYSLEDMEIWKNYPADRAMQFSKVFSAYQFWKNYADEVRYSYGIDDFEIKTFTF